MLLNAIFYILSFIAIIYYILIWTKNNQKLKEYILREKRKIRETWTKYKAQDTLSALKESFVGESFTGSTEDRSYTVCTGIESPAQCNATGVTHNSKPIRSGREFSVSGTASRANCKSWQTPKQTPGPYNDTDVNEYAHMDRDIYAKSNGANINPQQIAKDKLARINSVINSELPGYKGKVEGLLSTNGARAVFMNPPAYVKISASDSLTVGTDQAIQKYIADPFMFNLITPENRADILKQYPTDTWLSIYSKIQLIKYEFNETVNAKVSAANPDKYSKTYLQVSNIPDPNNDPVKGSSYYPSDRTYLNQEAGRRNIIQRELDKRVLSQQEYNDKWSWVDKIGEKLVLPAGFNLNSDAESILDVQPRSAMDILTDYDPSQFACPRIYQECGTRVAPGFALDAYNYEKYDKYLDSLTG